MYTVYLAHHGIKGQKWGIRRYQNEDGTLTSEGKKRYFDGLKADKKGHYKAGQVNAGINKMRKDVEKWSKKDIALLKEKKASGEISEEEYKQSKKDIRNKVKKSSADIEKAAAEYLAKTNKGAMWIRRPETQFLLGYTASGVAVKTAAAIGSQFVDSSDGRQLMRDLATAGNIISIAGVSGLGMQAVQNSSRIDNARDFEKKMSKSKNHSSPEKTKSNANDQDKSIDRKSKEEAGQKLVDKINKIAKQNGSKYNEFSSYKDIDDEDMLYTVAESYGLGDDPYFKKKR